MNITGSYYSALHITNIGFNSVNFFNNTASYNYEYTCMQWIFRVRFYFKYIHIYLYYLQWVFF